MAASDRLLFKFYTYLPSLLFFGIIYFTIHIDCKVSQNFCDVSTRNNDFDTTCVNCWQNRKVRCPGTAKKLTRLSGKKGCRYEVGTGSSVRRAIGCTHRCRQKVTTTTCCEGYWGPDCQSCPRDPIGLVCGNRGTCFDGYGGNGTCKCADNLSGSFCEVCSKPQFYGPSCGSVCACVHGSCDSGINGTGACYCENGYGGDACDQELEACSELPCHTNARCTGARGDVSCVCNVGYTGDGNTCSEINPCVTGTNSPCFENATCAHTGPDQSSCRCKAGFTGDGYWCEAIDPCQTNRGGCNATSSICIFDGPGQSHCDCKTGFILQGSQCVLKDICGLYKSTTCGPEATCNTVLVGGIITVECICPPGMVEYNRNCYDDLLSELYKLNATGMYAGRLNNALTMFGEGLEDQLYDPHFWTLFVPLDSAFNQDFFKIPGTPRWNILSRAHVVAGSIYVDFNDSSAKTMYPLLGYNYPIKLLSPGIIDDDDADDDDDGYFANLRFADGFSAKVLVSAKPAANGVIYIIDSVLWEDTMTDFIASGVGIQALRQFSTLSNFTELVSISPWMTLRLNDPPGYTLFAPNDAAMSELTDDELTYLKSPLGAVVLRDIFMYSIASDDNTVTSFELATRETVQTSFPISLSRLEDDGTIMIGEGRAKILKSDILVNTSSSSSTICYINIVDKFLIPPDMKPLVKNRCQDTVRTPKRGPCGDCGRPLCKPGGIPLSLQYAAMKQCVYTAEVQIDDGSARYVSKFGCSQLCRHTSNVSKCCPGFYGTECRSCRGPPQNPCNGNGVCSDSRRGSGLCTCNAGFIGDACEKCSNTTKFGANCDQDCTCQNGVCKNTIDSHGECVPGSCVGNSSGENCDRELTPCANGLLSCHQFAMCTPEENGNTSCACTPGYKGDGIYCEAYDPCDFQNNDYPCSVSAYCSNIGRGRSVCECFPNFRGNGKTCDPVDNCEADDRGGCSEDADCIYIGPGKHKCVCVEGYRGDGTTCTEINLCEENNGGCSTRARCEKTGPGTRGCTCFEGYETIGDGCVGNLLQEVALRSDLSQIQSWVSRWRQIRSLLNNLMEGFTCFFPMDSAWSGLSDDDSRFWLTEQHLPYVLKNHIVNELLLTSALIDREGNSVQTMLINVDIDINKNIVVDSSDVNVAINTTEITHLPTIGKKLYAKLIAPDIPVSGRGVIHIIDTVLVPPRDVVNDYPNLSTVLNGTGFENYVDFVGKMNESGYLSDLESSETPYTVFLAPNSAVSAAKISASSFNDTIEYHIIPGKLFRYYDFRSGEHLTPLLGSGYKLTLVRHHESLLVNGLSVLVDANRTDKGIVYRLTDTILRPIKTRCDTPTSSQVLTQCLPCHFPSSCPAKSTLLVETPCLYGLITSSGGAVKTRTGCQKRCAKESAISACCEGFYGDGCDPCPGGIGNICFGRGDCSDGIKGNGTCTCTNSKYAGTACETCASGIYGRECDNTCQCVHGICNDGSNGDGSCVCEKGYRGVNCNQAIDPTNSCNNTCHTAANCVPANVGPGTRCVCSAGYQGDGVNCEVVNPCTDPNINPGCHEHAICIRGSAGHHNCSCKTKYEGDGIYCAPVNPCFKSYGPKCDENADCFMIAPNSSRCVCKEFFEGDGKSCSPVDVCAKDHGGCSENAICTAGDSPGDRTCECKGDYYGDGVNCTGSIYSFISGKPRFNWFTLMDTFASLMPHILSRGNPIVAFLPSQSIMMNLNSSWLNYEEPATQLYLSHIVGCFDKTNLTGVTKIRTLAGDVLDITETASGFVINNSINVLRSPLQFWNGILYEIDHPIIPTSLTRVFSKAEPTQIVRILTPYMDEGMAETSPLYKNTKVLLDRGFQWVVTLLETSGELETLQYPLHNPWMLLLPNEEAFRKQTAQRLRSFMNRDDTTYASEYIRYHMIREAFITPTAIMDFEAKDSDLRTMQGSKITVQCAASPDIYGQMVVNNGMANIVGVDVFHFTTQTDEEKKSAVYVLDQVLDPPSIGGRCDDEVIIESTVPCGLCVGRDLTCPANTTLVSRDTCSLPIPSTGSGPQVNVPGCSITCTSYKKVHQCCPHYYGPWCQPCPGGANSPCSGNGKCSDGVNGTGICQCKVGFTGVACERCETGRYGRNCLLCQCTTHGHCNEGVTGDGACFCDPTYTGPQCAQSRNASNVCSPKCHSNGYCLNSGTCHCKPGYRGDGVTYCNFMEMCRVNNGGCSEYATCEINREQVQCKCRQNFVGDGNFCRPYDPCTSLTSTCHAQATCVVNSHGNPAKCVCKPGYEGDGVNQCSKREARTCNTNNGGCSRKATCTDVPPSVPGALPKTTCQCNAGSIGDGIVCHGSVLSIIQESVEMRDFFEQLKRLPAGYRRRMRSTKFNYTIFVPARISSRSRPTYAIKRHIIKGKALYYKDLQSLTSISLNTKLFHPVQNINGEVYINSVRVKKSDIIGTNGVVHIVESFIPGMVRLIPTISTSALTSSTGSTTKSNLSPTTKTTTAKSIPAESKSPTKQMTTIEPGGPIDKDATGTVANTFSQTATASIPYQGNRSHNDTSVAKKGGSNAVVIVLVLLLLLAIVVGGVVFYWWKKRRTGGFSLFRERSGYEEPGDEDFPGLTNPAYDSTGFNNDELVPDDTNEETALAMRD